MTDAPAQRAALYARVSTTDQDTGSQLARLRSRCEPVEIAPLEFVDDGVSGSLDSRPAFDRLREQIRAGTVGSVVVAKLDRLGRSAKTILEFFDLTERHGVRVVVTDQGPIDTSTPVGRLVRTVLAAMAELEADLIRERTQQAMDAFKAGTRTPKGRIGRPARLTPELLAEIRRLRDGGAKWSRVALTLHVPASSARKWYSNAKRVALACPSETSRVINRP